MTRFAPIVLLALASALAPSGAIRPPSVGEAAPDFKLADQDGKAVRLAAARGGKVVLVFYRGYW